MSTGPLTSDPKTMDVHLQANSHHHFGVNGGAHRNSRPSEDSALQFLSQEEQECILFFEETIESLEESLEEEEGRQGVVQSQASSTPVREVDGPRTLLSAPSPMSSLSDRPTSSRDQDIIDLVRPGPDLVQAKETLFNPIMPDFQSMMVNPESHFEMRPRRDVVDTLPSEYNPPLPGSGLGSSDGHHLYHPPGCIPTPVLIAQQIAENQGGGATNIHPSALRRRSSLETDKPSSYTTDHPVRHGPPTSAKPTRFPGNINVAMLGNKEHHNVTNVNLHERRAQMLANLTGTLYPLELVEPEQTSPQRARNVPTRSVSFRDPMPDKSRMEALSKLGLTRSRAMSGGVSVIINPNPSPAASVTDTKTSSKPPTPTIPSPTQTPADRKPETAPVDTVSSWRHQPIQANPSPPATVPVTSYRLPPIDTKPVSPPPEVTSLDFNSYGGKTVMVNPSASTKSESLASAGSHDSKAHQSAMANHSDFNSYGGKTTVMNPALVPMARSDLPDILSSHIDRSKAMQSPASPTAKPEILPHELNSYGGKTRTITPSTSSNPSSHSPGRTSKVSVPAPAPRPARHQGHPSPHKSVVRPPSPEPRRKSISKPASFRSQGITVQFSGRGQTDESRKEALRKLGLLKDTF